MEPARVSSPQVDLTRYGLDKTPTLLILRCLGVDPLRPKGKEVPTTDARPRWQSRGEARRGQKALPGHRTVGRLGFSGFPRD